MQLFYQIISENYIILVSEFVCEVKILLKYFLYVISSPHKVQHKLNVMIPSMLP